MKREWLMKYDSVQRWFSNILKESTRRVYLLALHQFVEFTGMTPDQIVHLGRKHPEEVHDRMKAYYSSLDLASKTCMARYQALRSFCRYNRVQIGRKPRTFRGVVEYESRRIYKRDEVADLIDAAQGFRDKGLIAFLAQSGQRIGIVTNLRLGHVDLNQQPPLIIEVPPVLRDKHGRNVNKAQRLYQFAVGTDTVQYLRLMIRERRKRGEPLDREAPLFRSYSVQSLPGPPEKKDYSEPGWPLSTSAAGQAVRDAAERAGIQEQHGKRYLWHPHGFRRYWKHQVRRGGMQPQLMEYMLGHTLPYQGAYDQWTQQDIRREYSKAEKYLRIRPQFKEQPVDQEMQLLRILLSTDRSRLEGIAGSLGISPVQIRELLRRVREGV